MVRSDLIIAGSNFIFTHIKKIIQVFKFKRKFLVIFRESILIILIHQQNWRVMKKNFLKNGKLKKKKK